jgi:glycosyltransferase involved in cell wall biosynthesis
LNKILFFGELAPNIVHGISLSNKLNIDLLKSISQIEVVEEQTTLSQHNKITFSKVKNIFTYLKKIYFLNKKNSYDYFYVIFSFSAFGSLKTLLSLFAFYLGGRGGIVLHVHRGDFTQFYQKNILNKLITKISFSLVDRIIALSTNQKKQFNNYISKDKIYVLENSLNIEYSFKNEKTNEDKFIYISNYIKEKGIFDLLEVFKKNNDLKLECFGGFVNNEDEIRKYENTKIKINGFINGKEKFLTLYNSNALIFPSWNEGQPTIILEAMMVGTIVLTTKVGLISELLGDDYPFYFKSQDVKSLEQCIKKFKEYKSKNELSKKMKIIYMKNFSRKIHEEKLFNIFRD